MSRLINDSASSSGRAGVSVSVRQAPLPPEQALVHLKRCQAIAVEHAHQSFGPFVKALNHAFDVLIDRAKSNQEVAELSGIQRLFRKSNHELEDYYAGYVAEGFVKFKQHALCTQFNTGGDGELSLVDNLELEESLILSGIVQGVDSELAEPLWVLNQRMALINGGEPVVEASNPCAPVQFSESMRKASKLVPMTIPAAKTVLKTFGEHLSRIAAEVVGDTNRYLAEQGLLQDLEYRQAKPKVAKREALESEVDALTGSDDKSAAYQSSLLGAIRGLQQTLASLSQSPQPLGAPVGNVLSNQQMIEALQAVQLQSMMNMPMVNAVPGQVTTPMNIAAMQQQLQAQLADKGRVGESDMHAIDLVGRVFEYMLRDDNLPDSVKAALSYLHTPFLKLAFIDPGFFENPDHPARVLLNNLAEAGIRWVGNDGTIEHNMLTKIRETVDRLLNEFTNDVKVITSVLLDFNSYTKNIVRRQELMEKRAAEKAQGEERLREVKFRVNQEVMTRTEEKDLPSSILLFLLQPWFDYLSFCLLRFGAESQQWVGALDLVDDLLWAINHKNNSDDVQVQKELIERLPADMQAGFEVIGYDADKAEKLTESIVDILRAAIAQEAPAPEPAPVRAEALKVVAEKKQATPLTPINEDVTDEEQRVIDGLKQIEFGTWFEFENGRRLKVAWYNARTMHYMLVNQVGKKEAMLTGLELARKMIAKTMHIVSGSSKPFFERALEDIYQNLTVPTPAEVEPV
ncbi:DUF1631 family protein [Marinagarivorans algicola]|uniref:DUF1631 family protein n=1 Tax=Marinagarivorans algicola TaxID=1513270 RepID=UPI0006B5D258|nr:DUF1631 family protein [Marinagarivorans algicola]